MEELFKRLEQGIQTLQKKFNQLSTSKQKIYQSERFLMDKNHQLQLKHKEIATQIATIVTRLKGIKE